MKKLVVAGGACLAVISLIGFYSWQSGNGFKWVGMGQSSQPNASHGKSRSTSDHHLDAAVGKGDAAKDFLLGSVSFDLIKQKAESGDAVAQRQLSEMYEDCAVYSFGPDSYLGTLDSLSAMKPASKPKIEQIKQQIQRFCGRVDGGQPIPLEAYKLWLEQSAKSGDPVAAIRYASLDLRGPQPKQLANLVDLVGASQNPQALFELSNLVAGYQGDWEDQDNERLFGKAYSNYAMAIAACRAGMNCSASSRLMRQVCTSTFTCNYTNYEQFVYSELVSPASRKDVEALAVEVGQWLQKQH